MEKIEKGVAKVAVVVLCVLFLSGQICFAFDEYAAGPANYVMEAAPPGYQENSEEPYAGLIENQMAEEADMGIQTPVDIPYIPEDEDNSIGSEDPVETISTDTGVIDSMDPIPTSPDGESVAEVPEDFLDLYDPELFPDSTYYDPGPEVEIMVQSIEDTDSSQPETVAGDENGNGIPDYMESDYDTDGYGIADDVDPYLNGEDWLTPEDIENPVYTPPPVDSDGDGTPDEIDDTPYGPDYEPSLPSPEDTPPPYEPPSDYTIDFPGISFLDIPPVTYTVYFEPDGIYVYLDVWTWDPVTNSWTMTTQEEFFPYNAPPAFMPTDSDGNIYDPNTIG